MDLQKELEELNRQIEADDLAALNGANDNEEKEQDTVEAESKENAEEPKKEEEPQPEKAASEPVEEKKEVAKIPDVKTDLEELPPEGGWAKLRWEAAEAKRKAAELERKLAERDAKPAVTKEENYEAYIESEIGYTKEELREIKAKLERQEQEEKYKQTLNQATNEFIEYEKQFKVQNTNVSDYEDATRHVVNTIARSIKVLNPSLDNDKVVETTRLELLKRASAALNAGKNPAAALYQQAYTDFGYNPKSVSEATLVEEKQEKKAPTLAKVAENRKRSAGMAGGGSGGSGILTNDSLSTMTNAELLKLTPSDWERLERETA